MPREWAGADEDTSFLLRGSDLRLAEAWFADGANHDEQPTAVQGQFIESSRRSAARRQRWLVTGVTIAMVLAVLLSIVALIQRGQAVTAKNQAQAQLRESQATAMAAESTNLLSTNLPLAVLVSIEARQRSATPVATNALAASATQPLTDLVSYAGAVQSLAFKS